MPGQGTIRVVLASEGRLRAAVDETVSAMRSMGQLEPVDEAAVVSLEVMADALDEDAGNAALWGQFRGALTDLRGLSDADDDELERLAAQMRAAVVDTPDK